MKPLKILIPVLFIALNSQSQNSYTYEFKALTISTSSLFNPPGSFDSISIFYLHGIKIFKVSNRFSSAISGPYGTITTEVGEHTNYYAFDTATGIGLHFNGQKIEKYDSSLEKFEHNNYPNIVNKEANGITNDKVFTINSNRLYNRIESEININNPDLKQADTCRFFYNKDFMNLEFAFGFPKEKELNLKLQKISMIFNLKKVPEWNSTMPETMEISIELKPVSQEAWDIAMTYYERAKKEFAKYLKE